MAGPMPASSLAANPAARQLRSVQDVASSLARIHAGRDGAAFRRVYRVTSGDAPCSVPPQLAAKYSLQQDNVQRVISITNRVTLDQAWWNPSRSSKPQTFKSRLAAADLDSTGDGARCDFCAWDALTARDAGFGRVELPGAVTGSNLFKYAEPSHGVVLFRRHDPLAFGPQELSDLLDASWLWFQQSAGEYEQRQPQQQQGQWQDGGPAGGIGEGDGEQEGGRLWPFFLWNCLPRAGASQYHGHAQVALTRAPVPQQAHLAAAAARHRGGPVGGGSAESLCTDDGAGGDGGKGGGGPGFCFYSDLLCAHRAAGLLRQVSVAQPPGAGGGTSSGSSSSLSSSDGGAAGAAAWEGHAWGFASLAPRKDCELVVVGSHLGCAAFKALLYTALRALIDGLGCATFNAAALNVDLSVPHPHGPALELRLAGTSSRGSSRNGGGDVDGGDGAASGGRRGVLPLPVDELWVPGAFPAARPPVVARLVSRGKLDNAASDFGGLEVFGGASIGHTDPYRVAAALDQQLAALAAAETG